MSLEHITIYIINMRDTQTNKGNEMKNFLIKIIKDEIKLGSESSSYNKAKANKFLSEIEDYEEFTFEGDNYDVHDLLLCVKFDKV